jgi:hypothetical protein
MSGRRRILPGAVLVRLNMVVNLTISAHRGKKKHGIAAEGGDRGLTGAVGLEKGWSIAEGSAVEYVIRYNLGRPGEMAEWLKAAVC